MLTRRHGIWAVQAAILAAFLTGHLARAFPLGVPGEWEWSRLAPRPSGAEIALAAMVIGAYVGFVVVGMRQIRRQSGRLRESAWVIGLLGMSIGAQAGVQTGAPEAYGLTKWVTLGMPGSSGYFEVAMRQMPDPWAFWARFPSWISGQDSLHIGTHPPGLFLGSRAVLGYFRDHPNASRTVATVVPRPIELGFRTILPSSTRAERAAFVLTGFLTLVACAATVVPIYFSARAWHGAPTAWAAASLWPLVPSAILFQPTSDTAFPLLSASALALCAWATRVTRDAQGAGPEGRAGVPVLALLLAFATGGVLAIGMQFSLVFLPVGLAVALAVVMLASLTWRSRLALIVATGVGFLLATLGVWAVSGANPFVIWWWNQKNHARFYVQYSRTYWIWLIVDPIELAVAIGIPVAVPALAAVFQRRTSSVSRATLFVLIVLNVSGRNMSEVARLWLPFMPGLLVAASEGLGDPPEGRDVALTLVLVGLQTLTLQSTIQVVYPV